MARRLVGRDPGSVPACLRSRSVSAHPGVAQPYSAAQPFGPAQQAAHGYIAGQYPAAATQTWRRRTLVGAGNRCGTGGLVVTFVFVLVSGDDDGSSPTKDPVAAGSIPRPRTMRLSYGSSSSTAARSRRVTPAGTSRPSTPTATIRPTSPMRATGRGPRRVAGVVADRRHAVRRGDVREASGSRIPVHYSVR